MVESFEEFCGGIPLWNESLLLNSSYPRFTECFMNTALVWGPCGLLWICLPVYIYFLSATSIVLPNPIQPLNVTKILVSILLFAVSIVQLVHHADSDSTYTAVYVADGVKIGTFLLTSVIVLIERHYGRINSLLLYPFWLLMVVANTIPLYTYIMEKLIETDELEFGMHCLLFALVTIQFFVFNFPEKRGRQGYQEISKTVSPELNASLPSMLAYWWTNKLIWTGFRNTLTEGDVHDLHPEDTSDTQVPKFARAWDKELERCAAYNEKYLAEHGSSVLSSMNHKVNLTADEKTKLLTKYDPYDNDNDKKSKEPKSPLKQPSLFRAMFQVYGFELICLQLLKTGLELLNFITPKITESMLSYIQGEKHDNEMWKGYVLAGSYFVISSIISLMASQLNNRNRRLGMHLRCSLTATIYRKSLTISNEAKKTTTLGEIVNLMSADCQRLENVMNFIYIVFSAPFQIAVALYMLYDQIGLATFAGLGVLVILLPMNTVTSITMRRFNRQMMRLKDRRIRLMNEVLTGMKVLKVYAWEEAFEKKVAKFRSEEINLIFKLSMVMAVLSLIFGVVPYFVQVASFGVFIAIDGYLDPTKAFVSMSLFNNLTQTFTQMPMFIPALIQAAVSVTRIVAFLRQPDLKPDARIIDPKLDTAIKIEHGTFTWDEEFHQSTLKNINLNIKPGSLVAVVGTVGCGKSSLLAAIMGEMTKQKGAVTVKSNMAYVPQEAWIQNKTLRENILFGTDYKSSLYERVIEACALKTDLEILPGGDLTEIGEKGINISGGQKQRVSLARAVYSRADIYLLDDPLSAVDSHVGKHIFQNVISNKGVLKGKTRVLVTHGVHWLPLVDTIIVLKDGEISETGSYEQLVSHDGEFAQFLKEFFIQEAESEDEGKEKEDPEIEEMKKQVLHRLESLTGASSADEAGRSLRRQWSSTKQQSNSSVAPSRGGGHAGSGQGRGGGPQGGMPGRGEYGATRGRGGGPPGGMGRGGGGPPGLGGGLEKGPAPVVAGQRLVLDETSETGGVKINVYMDYLRSVGFGSIAFSVLFYLVYLASTIFSSIWLSKWTDDPYLANRTLSETDEYADKTNLYIGLYAGMGVIQGIFSYTFSASLLVKTAQASNVLHNTMMHNIMRSPMSFFDTTPTGRIVNRFSKDVDVLDNQLPNLIRQGVNSVGRVLMSLINITYSTPIVLAVIVPVVVLYIIVQRIYIPASRQIRRIDSTTRSPIYVHFSETLSGVSSIRAYGVQERFTRQSQELVDYNFKFYFASIVIGSWLQVRLQFLGNIIVLAAAMFAQANTGLSAGLAGLAISYAQQVTNALTMVVQVATQAETNIVSAERILEYAEIPTEAPWEVPETEPPKSWPDEGRVAFDDLQFRYREGLELVLKGVTCDLKGGEKVGIVGRTGAGKSSLSVALFRLAEAAAGKISIDERNIAALGLHNLRGNITILPQDPVIFSGTLRMNLDPSEKHSDEQIWEALEHAHLKSFVKGLPSQLDYQCGEGGQNLSMGQRQLLCLARCLLRKSKILVLDEATAAVDMETDDLIQKTIRSEFKDSTVLTIAHRLNTIMDYDRVIVMDKGKIIEMDSPQALLANTQSVFYSMAKDANLV
ncbi:hypothetical protein BsWGS_22915 [Bradybaena similaris]